MTEIRRRAYDQFTRFGENDPVENFNFERPAWQALGACVGADPNIFFPTRGEDTREAKKICSGCSVKEECLDFGINEKFGIFGGLSERQRRDIRRKRRQSNE